MTTAELIEKLERAEGPSRELDWEIHLRNGLQGVGMYGDHPHYTASIDAALTLVPEGWIYEGRQGPSRFPHMWALSTIKSGDVRYTTVTGRARSAAIALCIAALRAKEADNG